MKIYGKELKFNNNKVYHANDKPTPSEIGAASSSHTHSQYITTDKIMDGAQAKIYLWSSEYIANNYLDYTSTAAAAKKLNTGNTGSSLQPVYFSDGKPVAGYSYFTRDTQGDIGWGTANNNSPLTVSAVAYWNGAYQGTTSNLAYCKHGALGTIVTRNSGDYLASSGGTMTGTMSSSLLTGTYLEGSRGKAIVSSTQGAGQYVALLRSNSNNGYFTLSNYQQNFQLNYMAKSTVDAGTNATTKQAVLLNESGNSTFPGTVSMAEAQINGKRLSIGSSAPGSPATGTVWIQV